MQVSLHILSSKLSALLYALVYKWPLLRQLTPVTPDRLPLRALHRPSLLFRSNLANQKPAFLLTRLPRTSRYQRRPSTSFFLLRLSGNPQSLPTISPSGRSGFASGPAVRSLSVGRTAWPMLWNTMVESGSNVAGRFSLLKCTSNWGLLSSGHAFARTQDKRRHLREQATCRTWYVKIFIEWRPAYRLYSLRPVGRNGVDGVCSACLAEQAKKKS